MKVSPSAPNAPRKPPRQKDDKKKPLSRSRRKLEFTNCAAEEHDGDSDSAQKVGHFEKPR